MAIFDSSRAPASSEPKIGDAELSIIYSLCI
jgi:hypothetical protein